MVYCSAQIFEANLGTRADSAIPPEHLREHYVSHLEEIPASDFA